MSLLSREGILESKDLQTHDEPIPEWPNPDGSPGVVRLSELGADRMMELTKLTAAQPNDGMFIILAFSAIDAEGNTIFTVEDVAALRKKNMKVLNRLQNIAFKLNGIDLAGAAEIKKD